MATDKSSPKMESSHSNVLRLIFLLAIIICICNLLSHLIDRWDGHLYDTRGCTTLQNTAGKIFKVNSCDGTVEPIEIPIPVMPVDVPRNPLPALTPEDAKPQLPPQTPPLPVPKKPLTPKTAEPPKPAPYMI
jgi:hypothetical protein